ncbi:MAG TPA: carboxylesterase family protein [Croceibacterium sp.]|nr:carboxylesterase family protein [Croceibacterium sp.]
MPVTRWLAAALLAAAPFAAAAQDPVVATEGGLVAGVLSDGAAVFRGIPFAAPPLGERRWRPPAPVTAWDGVRSAREPAPACLQNLEGWNRADWLHASEDCLTLDIRTPDVAGKRPVMVWIHGGSNRSGSPSGITDANITDQGVVHVGVRYRLGVLGFLSHPALTAEQGGTSGNYGLMDQIMALRWVRDNIARFGGDPANVTIYGESAGAQDVSLLLSAPPARGLFHRAILQSGTPGFGMSFRPLAEAEALGRQLDEAAGSGGDISRLRALSPVALLTLQERTIADPQAEGGRSSWLRTTVDGLVLPDAPDRLLRAAPPVPVVIGTNAVEFGAGAGSVADMTAFATQWFAAPDEVLAAYRAEEQAGADPRRGHLELRMQSDGEFVCPADRLANLLAEEGWPVWRYEFDVGENGGLTRHAYEIGFVFDRKPVGGGALMQDYWAAFAITGDPNGATAIAAERPRWQRWQLAAPRQMAFDEGRTGMEPGATRAAFCRFAKNL